MDNREYVKEKLREIYDNCIQSKVVEIYKVFVDYFGEDNVDLQLPDKFADFMQLITSLTYINSEDEIQYGVNAENSFLELYNYPIERINVILNTLNNSIYNVLPLSEYFSYILVKFPEVKITNENNDNTRIKNFFVKICISKEGYFKNMKCNKTHYTYAHFIHGYMHSHVGSGAPSSCFKPCCTGSGPINNTISILSYNYDLSQWLQYCWDLDKYVTIESLEGIPYIKLSKCKSEQISGTSLNFPCSLNLENKDPLFYYYRKFPKDCWNNFLNYLIDNKVFKFKWHDNQWKYAYDYNDLIILTTNSFLKWYKSVYGNLVTVTIQELLNNRHLIPAVSSDNCLYNAYSGVSYDLEEFRGMEMFIFKNEMQYLEIDNPLNIDSNNEIVILELNTINYILGYILSFINCNYNGKENNTEVE